MKRTLLLGPCGGCKDHANNKEKWKMLGTVMLLFNTNLQKYLAQGMTNNQAQAQAGADIQSVIQVWNNGSGGAQHGKLPYTSNAFNIDNITEAEYNRIGAACGFGK